jgi:predicted cation transporter
MHYSNKINILLVCLLALSISYNFILPLSVQKLKKTMHDFFLLMYIKKLGIEYFFAKLKNKN